MEAICLLAWLSASDRDKAELAEAASDLVRCQFLSSPSDEDRQLE